MSPPLSRRHFIRTGTLAAGALAGSALSGKSPETTSAASEMQYRTLGKTGLKISEIGFGGYPVKDEKVVEYALAKGINYFDSSNCYPQESEVAIGKGIKGKRDQVVLATKWCPHHVHLPVKKASFLKQLDESLTRLQTDHVDVLFNHQMGPSDGESRGDHFSRLDHPELLEAWETARQSGKARFFGVSGHEGNLMEIMNHVVESGRFDVILCRYHFMNYPTETDLIKKCDAHGVGFIAMKTLAGAKGADVESFRNRQTSYKQAALKWVLSHPQVSNLIISISSKQQVDEYIGASGSPFSVADRVLLDEYRHRFSTEVCRFASDCEPACPHQVRIADILRASMYFQDYHEEKHGIDEYASIPEAHRVRECSDCHAPCVKVCPHELPIKDLLLTAHRQLSVRPTGA